MTDKGTGTCKGYVQPWMVKRTVRKASATVVRRVPRFWRPKGKDDTHD